MAKPNLALIPAAQGTKFYSVLPSDGVGDFDFTRASAATRVNKDGLIETIASGQSRLNYPLIDGVVNGCPHHLLEPSRQNVLWYSQDFTNAYWINSTAEVNADQAISPDGTLNADLLTGVGGIFGVVRFNTWSATNNVASCFAKKASSSTFIIKNASGVGDGGTFDLENGTIISVGSGFTGEIENYGNGWYRCTVIDTLGRSGTLALGVNGAGESIYMWGAQMEQTHKTSYIPTVNSSVTRVAETANGSGDASTFNDSEGVLYIESKAFIDTIALNRKIVLGDGTFDNGVEFSYQTTTNKMQFIVRSGGVISMLIETTSYDVTEFNKIAISYKLNEGKVFVNGVQLGSTDTSVVTPIGINTLSFDYASSFDFEGSVKDTRVYNTVLTDSELEKLTSWTSFTDLANGQQYSIK